MLGLVCGSFLRLLVFAWDLLRVVVLGFWVGVSSGMYFVVWACWEFLLDFGFLGALGFVRA